MAAAAIIAMRNAKKKRDEHFDNMTDEELEELANKRKLEEEEAAKPKYNKEMDYELEGRHPMVKKYLKYVATPSLAIAVNENFNLFITFVIIAAGIIVGFQTHRYWQKSIVLFVLDWIILIIFTFECLVKAVGEGMAPWRYFTGPEWKWNNFDFLIVFLSYPIIPMEGGGMVKLLRLVRLARLAKLIRKIPPLQVIVMGLVGGLKSIVYIMLLLFIVLYLYGILGMILFYYNDPWHFGSLVRALVSLFRASTLEDWTDIMYINYFKCDGKEYDSGIYNTLMDEWNNTRSGVSWPDGCPVMCHSNDKYLDVPTLPYGVKYKRNGPIPRSINQFYWISFIVISALVMLSLFIGAVTMSMTESLEDMKTEAEEKKRRKQYEKRKKKAEAKKRAMERLQGEAADAREAHGLKRQLTTRSFDKEQAILKKKLNMVMRGAWEGVNLLDLLKFEREEVSKRNILIQYYWRLSVLMDNLTQSSMFQNMITLVICAAGLMVGIQSEITTENPVYASCDESCTLEYCAANPSADECSSIDLGVNSSMWNGANYNCISNHDVELVCPLGCIKKTPAIVVLDVFEVIITVIFTCEVVFKAIAKFDKPWRYFYYKGLDGWNTFDFIVVAGTFVPGGGSMLVILRLLRLLRVLKLLKAFPELQVIVNALISGLGSIGYIGVILFLVFYVFGILGMILFQENDPWHFGTIEDSIFSLFRASTLEDWTDIMFTNSEGCANYGAFVMCEDVGQANCAARMLDDNDIFAYDELFCCCREKSVASPFAAYTFFIFFTILGALVLMTLFIGVITTSMEEAQQAQKASKEDEEAVEAAILSMGLGPEIVAHYKTVFNLLDTDGSGGIDEDELKSGLEKIGIRPTEEQLEDMYVTMNNDGSDDITYVQFMKLMCSLKEKDIVRRNSSFEGNLLDMDVEAVKKEMKENSGEVEGLAKIEETTSSTASNLAKVVPSKDEKDVEMTNIVSFNTQNDEENQNITESNDDNDSDNKEDVKVNISTDENNAAKVTV